MGMENAARRGVLKVRSVFCIPEKSGFLVASVFLGIY
jgi:hypothetical protein